jgi:nucleoside-diphosphate-sugar epimerase
MNKKVLITGGAGFIGLNLANKLLDQNYSVHIVDNFARGVYDAEFENTVERERASFSKINLLSINDINKEHEINKVYYGLIINFPQPSTKELDNEIEYLIVKND